MSAQAYENAAPMAKKNAASNIKAGNILRNQAELDQLMFIGYSMPPSDLEAKALFNYADWYNSLPVKAFYHGKPVPTDKCYSYRIVVVNPSTNIAANYKLFRKAPLFLPLSPSPMTGALSHCRMRCSIPPSTMRSATTAISLACGILSKYFDRSASMTWV